MGFKEFVEYEDLGKLKYCGQVFKETLRLYPVAPGTARENLEEVTVSGFRIPAHSWIIVGHHFMFLYWSSFITELMLSEGFLWKLCAVKWLVLVTLNWCTAHGRIICRKQDRIS